MAEIILPYDTSAESAVVCSVINKPELYNLSEFLKPSHFYNRELGAIHWAIGELLKEGIYEIDTLNLIIKCNENKGVKRIIDEFGGDDFIKGVVDNHPSMARETIDEYLMVSRKVTELGFRRELYKKLKGFERETLEIDKPLGDLNSKIITTLDDLADQYVSNEKIVLYSDRLDSILSKIDEKRQRANSGGLGLPTAWKALDEFVSYESGDLYIYAARRKHGKSLILNQESIHKAKMGLKVALFSTEMSDEKDTIRMLAMLSGIPVDDVKRGNIQGYREQNYLDAIHFLKHADFTRDYHPSWNREMVYTRLKAISHKMGGLDFFVHDYIKDPISSDSSQKYNELGKWADFLKNQIAGTFEIPVVSAVQLNRQYQIADSDLIERYATTGIKWMPKTKEEIIDDTLECGNYKLNVFFSRDGGEMEEDEYLDFYMDKDVTTTNLRISEAKKQHNALMPEFISEQ